MITMDNLTVFGDGSQTRSFCHIDDQVEGIYRLLFTECSDPINIGNPLETTLEEFAEKIIRLTGTQQKIIYKPLPQDDPLQRQPDISKANKILDWGPKIERLEELKIVYDYIKSLLLDVLQRKAHREYFQ